MNDWLRSLTVLTASFAGVVVLTVGLAVLIVPAPVGSSESPQDGASEPPATAVPLGDLDAIPTAIGGTVVVSGARDVSLVLEREATDGQYGLVGDDARVFVSGGPLSVTQMNLDGLSFFPDPDECVLTPGRLNQEIGVASVRLRCTEIADIRDNGVVTVEGVVGIAADVLGMRGDLPTSGGTATVGDVSAEFPEARLYTRPIVTIGDGPASAGMGLVDGSIALYFGYDVQTHGISLTHVQLDGGVSEVAPGACNIATDQLGMVNPRTTVLDMSVTCPTVDLAETGVVTIEATLVVELIEFSF